MNSVLPYSLVVALGYIPLGTTFGILYDQTGYPLIYAVAMAVLVYAGSAQFLAVTLLSNRVPIFDVFLFTFILNSRHIFYSIYTFKIYKDTPLIKRLYLMLALTDETFSIVTTLPEEIRADRSKLIKLSMLNHLWWSLGCTIGAVAGQFMDITVKGLDFALTSLFVILLIEQFYQANKSQSVLLGSFSGLIALILFSEKHFLLGSIGLFLVLFTATRLYGQLVSR